MLRETNPFQFEVYLTQESLKLAAKTAGYLYTNAGNIAAMAKFNLGKASSGTPTQDLNISVGRLPAVVSGKIKSLYSKYNWDFDKIKKTLHLPNISSLSSCPLEGKWKYEYVTRYGSKYAGHDIAECVIMSPYTRDYDTYYDIVICM